MVKQAILEGFSCTAVFFILVPLRIMSTSALSDSGTHFDWQSGGNVALNIPKILKKDLYVQS